MNHKAEELLCPVAPSLSCPHMPRLSAWLERQHTMAQV